MALSHSPKITTDGLVFYYDMNNSQKSWKGMPTVNLMPNPTFASDLTPWNYQTSGNGSATLDTNIKYGGNNSVRIERTSAGGETNVYLDLSASRGLLPNTQYTFTAYCLATAPNQAALFSYFGSTSNGFVYHSGSGKWERLVHTFTTRGTEPYIQIRMFHNATTLNSPVWFSTLQVEQNTFTSPFVNGSRSNTQAVVDLTNNNTITASSLTYASNGTFSFNGSGNYINCGNTSLINFGTGNFTLSFVSYRTATGFQGGSYVSKGDGTSLGFDFRDGSFFVHGSTGLIASMTFDQTQNVWQQHDFVFDRSANPYIKYYLNGVYTSSSTTNNSANIGATINTSRNLDIGRSQAGGVDRYFNGNMPSVKLYNRALSAAEVQQNFNAIRGRYGI